MATLFQTTQHLSLLQQALSPVGQLLLIERVIGEFVRYDGEVVSEADTDERLICPYKTVSFRVFVLEDGREWRDVQNLNDSVFFLGGNQSFMVQGVGCDELKKNSIYFTDDYWSRIDQHFSYGGHDMGVYSLEDGSIEDVFEDVLDDPELKIYPPPVWISLDDFVSC